MYHYFVAFNRRNHNTLEPLGTWAECNGYMSTYEFAKVIAKDRIKEGFKNVTIFKYSGNPYDKIMTQYVSWNLVMNNKID
jgi:hypothetical protein